MVKRIVVASKSLILTRIMLAAAIWGCYVVMPKRI